MHCSRGLCCDHIRGSVHPQHSCHLGVVKSENWNLQFTDGFFFLDKRRKLYDIDDNCQWIDNLDTVQGENSELTFLICKKEEVLLEDPDSNSSLRHIKDIFIEEEFDAPLDRNCLLTDDFKGELLVNTFNRTRTVNGVVVTTEFTMTGCLVEKLEQVDTTLMRDDNT